MGDMPEKRSHWIVRGHLCTKAYHRFPKKDLVLSDTFSDEDAFLDSFKGLVAWDEGDFVVIQTYGKRSGRFVGAWEI